MTFVVFYHGRNFTDDCGRFDSESQAWSFIRRSAAVYQLNERDFSVELVSAPKLALV